MLRVRPRLLEYSPLQPRDPHTGQWIDWPGHGGGLRAAVRAARRGRLRPMASREHPSEEQRKKEIEDFIAASKERVRKGAVARMTTEERRDYEAARRAREIAKRQDAEQLEKQRRTAPGGPLPGWLTSILAKLPPDIEGPVSIYPPGKGPAIEPGATPTREREVIKKLIGPEPDDLKRALLELAAEGPGATEWDLQGAPFASPHVRRMVVQAHAHLAALLDEHDRMVESPSKTALAAFIVAGVKDVDGWTTGITERTHSPHPTSIVRAVKGWRQAALAQIEAGPGGGALKDEIRGRIRRITQTVTTSLDAARSKHQEETQRFRRAIIAAQQRGDTVAALRLASEYAKLTKRDRDPFTGRGISKRGEEARGAIGIGDAGTFLRSVVPGAPRSRPVDVKEPSRAAGRPTYGLSPKAAYDILNDVSTGVVTTTTKSGKQKTRPKTLADVATELNAEGIPPGSDIKTWGRRRMGRMAAPELTEPDYTPKERRWTARMLAIGIRNAIAAVEPKTNEEKALQKFGLEAVRRWLASNDPNARLGESIFVEVLLNPYLSDQYLDRHAARIARLVEARRGARCLI